MRVCVLTLCVTILVCSSVYGGRIGTDAFGPGAVVEEYGGALPSFDCPTPVVISGDTYVTRSGRIREAAGYGTTAGGTGAGLAPGGSLDFVDITLGIPTSMAGLCVGQSVAWSAAVDFYDPSGMLLGTVNVSGLGMDGVFVGWQADTGLIGRIRATATTDNERVLCIDNLTKEAPVPDYPVIHAIADQTARVGELFTYAVNATGNPPPTFSLTLSPAGMTIDAVTGRISWTPGEEQTGARAVKIRAVNSAGSAEAIMHISVPLVAPKLASIPDQTATVAQRWTYRLVLLAGSPNPVPQYTLTVQPSGMRISGDLMDWVPTVAQTGTHSVTVKASNSSGSDSQSFAIDVKADTQPHVFQLRIYAPDYGTIPTPGAGAFTYAEGTVVSIEARPNAGYHFLSWVGSAVEAGKVADSLSPSTTVLMHADYVLEARFEINSQGTHKLSVYHNEGGTVVKPGEDTFRYRHGSTVWVLAHPDPGYHFVSWTGSAVAAGRVTDPASVATTLDMEADYTLAAKFEHYDGVVRTLTMSSGTGGSISYPGRGELTYDDGTSVTVTAQVDDTYHFVQWTGTAVDSGKVADPKAASTTVIVDGDYTLTANFELGLGHALHVSSGAGGSVLEPGEGVFEYDPGTVVTIVAQADDTYRFVQWTGTAVDNGRVADPKAARSTVRVDGEYTLVADFESTHSGLHHTLTVQSGKGGSVSAPGVGAFLYDQAAIVSVHAVADSGHRFTGWIGTAVDAGKVASRASASTTVTVDGDYTLVACFELDQPVGQYTLTVSSTGGGTVAGPGLGAFLFDADTVVMLEAKAKPSFRFVGWTGSHATAMNPVSITLDEDHQICAVFASALQTLVVDDNAPADPNADEILISDPDEDGTRGHPFDSIQEAIGFAQPGARILVCEGVYRERLDLLGKPITLMGAWLADPTSITPPIVTGNGAGPILTFDQGEDPNCRVSGLLLPGRTNGSGPAILCKFSSPTLSNCLIVGHDANTPGGAVISCMASRALFLHCTIAGNTIGTEGAILELVDSPVTLRNSIVWGNPPSMLWRGSGSGPVISYCDIEGGAAGLGNLDASPQFANPGLWSNGRWKAGDYHLQSCAGRWVSPGRTWAIDGTTSPCIDMGDPTSDFSREPQPNGSRINLGAYGGTPQASKSCTQAGPALQISTKRTRTDRSLH